jgi:hypothetical protein
MNESELELTERLRAEGRWAEASKFKDTALASSTTGQGVTRNRHPRPSRGPSSF